MDDLPLSVYSEMDKTPKVPDSYLWMFLDPILKHKVKTSLSQLDLERINERQNSLQDEIVRFTEQKVTELNQFAEHVLKEKGVPSTASTTAASGGRKLSIDSMTGQQYQVHQAEQAQQAQLLQPRSPKPPSSPSNSSNSSVVSSKGSTPLKSSLVKSRSFSESESDGAGGKKSPKRVAFALQDEVSIVKSDYSSDSEGDGGDTDDDNDNDKDEKSKDEGTLLGESVYLEPEEIEKEMNSLTISGIVPGGMSFDRPSKQADDYKRDDDVLSKSDSEDMFEFDEAMDHSIHGNGVSVENEAEVSPIEAPVPAPDETYMDPNLNGKLVSPSISSSLPKPNFDFNASKSKFKPRPVTKYLQNDDYYDDSDIHQMYITTSSNAANTTPEISYGSSLPIAIQRPPPPKDKITSRKKDLERTEEEIAEQQSTDNGVISGTGTGTGTGMGTGIDLAVHKHRTTATTVDEQLAALNSEADSSSAAYSGSMLTGSNINPANMSFSERMAWENQNSSRM